MNSGTVPASEGRKMFNVQITYKSGKVEMVKIAISQYSSALKQLGQEGRVAQIEIISVE
jgi:hypothetical protein